MNLQKSSECLAQALYSLWLINSIYCLDMYRYMYMFTFNGLQIWQAASCLHGLSWVVQSITSCKAMLFVPCIAYTVFKCICMFLLWTLNSCIRWRWHHQQEYHHQIIFNSADLTTIWCQSEADLGADLMPIRRRSKANLMPIYGRSGSLICMRTIQTLCRSKYDLVRRSSAYLKPI